MTFSHLNDMAVPHGITKVYRGFVQMTHEEYEDLINSISNEEVAEIMFGVLFKIHMRLEEIAGDVYS